VTALLAAALLSVLSAVGYAGAAVAQQRVAVKTSQQTEHSALVGLLAARGWWLAVGLNGFGAVLHVAALRYGPLSLVQPLGALTLVMAVPLAAFTGKRSVSRREWRGAAVTMVGLAGLFALTSPEANAASHALDFAGVISLSAVTGIALLLLVSSAKTAGGSAGSLLYATAAGAAFAVASVLTKTMTQAMTGSGTTQLLLLAGAAIAVSAVAGLLLAQAAYRDAEVAAPTATITLVNPVIAAAIGILLLGERLQAGVTGAVLALVFAAVCAYGVIVLVNAEAEVKEQREALADAQHSDELGSKGRELVTH
jgi:drug/metabolite transporter (DMT)-like permease